MFNDTELATVRQAYARQVAFLGNSQNQALEKAYASVRREAFLGPGPWPIFRWPGYTLTPDADPAWLYSDVLVGIVPERGLNNGQPSAHATWIDAGAPSPGEHVVHIGAGTGYYSAIMAHMVAPTGSLTAIEYDEALAARAKVNLSLLPNVDVLQGDGSRAQFAPADVIYVNAGASRPVDTWLDGLNEGGRLILPLTTAENFSDKKDFENPSGAVFRITRRHDGYEAAYVGPIAVFPCVGGRDAVSEQALVKGFAKGGYERVKWLRRTADVPDEDCWVKASGWNLTYR